MTTPALRFAALLDEFDVALQHYLKDSCSIQYDPHNHPGSNVIVLTEEGDYWLIPPTATNSEKHADTITKCSRAMQMADWLVIDRSVFDGLQELEQTLRHAFRVHHSSTAEVAEAFRVLIDRWKYKVDALLDDWTGPPVYIPDTNALIRNPDLDSWSFEAASRFTVLLLPTVLQELDLLKGRDGNSTVSTKAESVISRIKGWRDRGSLRTGVTLRRDKIYLKSVALEPNFNRMPSWLDRNRRDDQIIATIFNVMRDHPRTDITFVTSDINLQNKADHFEIPFCDPPKPLAKPEI